MWTLLVSLFSGEIIHVKMHSCGANTGLHRGAFGANYRRSVIDGLGELFFL